LNLNSYKPLCLLTGTAFPENILCDRLILFESRLAPEGPAYFSVGEYLLGK
jgi:hypothetical protein